MDIWEPMSNSGLQSIPDRCLFGLILCSCPIRSVHSCQADFLSFNTVGFDWAFLVSKIFITVLLCARDYGLPLFTSASALLPSSGLFSPRALALCHFLREAFPDHPRPSARLVSICTQSSPCCFIAVVKIIINCIIIGSLFSLLAIHERKGPCLSSG